MLCNPAAGTDGDVCVYWYVSRSKVSEVRATVDYHICIKCTFILVSEQETTNDMHFWEFLINVSFILK